MTVAPNPHSPFANAHPMVRHLLAGFLGIAPEPGSLAITGCGRMAVTPDEALTDVTALISAGRVGALPPGLCPHCVGVAAGEELPDDYPRLPPAVCRECRGQSSQGVLCALCRQDFHDKWWPTRPPPKPRPTAAPDRLFGHYFIDGGACRACEAAGRTTTERAGFHGELWGRITKRMLLTDDGEAVLGLVCLVCDVVPPAPHRPGGQP